MYSPARKLGRWQATYILPMTIPDRILDWQLAWRRSLFDIADRRAFVRHPYDDLVLANDLASWLATLAQSVHLGAYRPHTCRIVAAPKQHGHVRPGADLHLADQVVYAALLEQMRPQIAAALGPSSGSRDYSYHLRADATHTEWFEHFFARWQAFDRDSVLAIDQGAQFVVVADAAGCYEDIDLSTLRSDLNALGINADVLSLLMDCLHRRPRVQRRGIPQGHSPSDLLAKLYLRAVDRSLIAEGFNHNRWVDDFRIFCMTEHEARRALVALADVLGRRGLVLQTAKTRTLSADAARARFNEVHMLLDPIQANAARELAQEDYGAPSHLPPWQLDRVLAAAGAEGAIQVLRSAFYAYFVALGVRFTKSLFHYLLSRLSAANDVTYVSEAVGILRIHPEEFDHIADYCAAVSRRDLLETAFLDQHRDGLLPYPYMMYQFLRWRSRADAALAPACRLIVRQCAFEHSHPWFVRAIACAVLAKLGDAADLDSMEAAYAGAQSSIERAELICGIQRIEAGRRNALFGRAAGDGDLVSSAERLARWGPLVAAAC